MTTTTIDRTVLEPATTPEPTPVIALPDLKVGETYYDDVKHNRTTLINELRANAKRQIFGSEVRGDGFCFIGLAGSVIDPAKLKLNNVAD
jgi:hypothetical protein